MCVFVAIFVTNPPKSPQNRGEAGHTDKRDGAAKCGIRMRK